VSAAHDEDQGHVELGEWLRGDGPEADIAICTRVRFARNVEGFRFSPQMTDDEAIELERYIAGVLTDPSCPDELTCSRMQELDDVDRLILVEKHLISRELASAHRASGVALDHRESVSVMVNEEDHIRAQIFRSGLGVDEAFAHARNLDEWLLSRLPAAFSEEFGFLTSCPTNTGTGMRISVMLHLPGLVWADEIEKATHTSQKIHLAVRGMSGEGSQAVADLYQVSNQVTLGRTEDQLRDDVRAAVTQLVQWERKVREALLRGDSRARTLDRVGRALGVLQNAHLLNSDECANQEAQRFNHEYIGTEHILLGLVKEGIGRRRQRPEEPGRRSAKIRLEVEKLVKTGPTW
jgi:protein arginine kinase